MSLLQVEKLWAGYGKNEIVKDISFQLNKGEIIGILGPNGCGKSTLMKALCKGISYKGRVSIENQDIHNFSEKKLAQSCSYVPQRSGLSIDITALDVVQMGFYPYLGILENPKEEMRTKAKKKLELVGLKEQILANYMELSEGQKRMCILARCLVADTPLLLMDEPDAALDFGIRNTLLQIVSKRVLDSKAGVLLTLHDTNLAMTYCDRIYLMKNGSFVDEICPREDSIAELERKLSQLYGRVQLLEYVNEAGEKKFVMVQ